MLSSPPLAPEGKNLRLARWLNLALPGAGLFYMGRRGLGAALAVPFLACFLAALGLFLVSYARYLSLAMSDNLLEGDRLESFGQIFPTAWLVGLACVGALLQVCSMILYHRAKKAVAAGPSPPPPPAKT